MTYKPPWLYRSAHLSSIIPNRLRPVSNRAFERTTLSTPDGDFVDLDVCIKGQRALAILVHGLEGSSHSTYMLGMANALVAEGIDVVMLNHRTCSGRVNNLVTCYHSGFTADLEFTTKHFAPDYTRIHWIGFSLGGNMVLKLAGEVANIANLSRVIAISVPCDLEGSSRQLERVENRIYLNRFLTSLKKKALEKSHQFPHVGLDEKAIKASRSFFAFDDAFTAPVHGFDSAIDYYTKCSSRYSLNQIRNQTLIINALNDPFLSSECYPYEAVQNNPQISMLNPKYGGHVGFASNLSMNKMFWHEQQALRFIHGAAS